MLSSKGVVPLIVGAATVAAGVSEPDCEELLELLDEADELSDRRGEYRDIQGECHQVRQVHQSPDLFRLCVWFQCDPGQASPFSDVSEQPGNIRPAFRVDRQAGGSCIFPLFH